MHPVRPGIRLSAGESAVIVPRHMHQLALAPVSAPVDLEVRAKVLLPERVTVFECWMSTGALLDVSAAASLPPVRAYGVLCRHRRRLHVVAELMQGHARRLFVDPVEVLADVGAHHVVGRSIVLHALAIQVSRVLVELYAVAMAHPSLCSKAETCSRSSAVEVIRPPFNLHCSCWRRWRRCGRLDWVVVCAMDGRRHP